MQNRKCGGGKREGQRGGCRPLAQAADARTGQEDGGEWLTVRVMAGEGDAGTGERGGKRTEIQRAYFHLLKR